MGLPILHQEQLLCVLKCSSVVRKEWRSGGICGVRNVKILTKHLIVKVTEDSEIIRGFAVPNFENLGVSGFVHVANIGPNGVEIKRACDSPPTGLASLKNLIRFNLLKNCDKFIILSQKVCLISVSIDLNLSDNSCSGKDKFKHYELSCILSP